MGMGLQPGPEDADARLVGVLRLLNALIGIRLRSVSDPESRRHLNWLNDIIAAVGLLSQRFASGRLADYTDYLQSAVEFWRRSASGRPVVLTAPGRPVAVGDQRAACLAIVAHELLGAALSRPVSAGGDGEVSVRLQNDAEGLRLTVESEGGVPGDQDDEALELVRGMAEHLGGTVEVAANGRRAVTVRLAPEARRGQRH